MICAKPHLVLVRLLLVSMSLPLYRNFGLFLSIQGHHTSSTRQPRPGNRSIRTAPLALARAQGHAHSVIDTIACVDGSSRGVDSPHHRPSAARRRPCQVRPSVSLPLLPAPVRDAVPVESHAGGKARYRVEATETEVHTEVLSPQAQALLHPTARDMREYEVSAFPLGCPCVCGPQTPGKTAKGRRGMADEW